MQFQTWTWQHNVLVGLEASFERRENFRITINDFARINLIYPDPGIGGTLSPTQAATISNASDIGIYAQDQIKVTDWLELLGGVRYDNFRADADTYTLTTATGAIASPLSLNSNNNFTTYRAGAVVHPTSNTSVYYMRGTSANPPAEYTTITNGQQALAPVTSTIDEVGAKAELLEKKLTASAAVFQIKKENDYENQGTTAAPLYGPVGTTQVKGFETGITGQITAPWAIYAGYTYLDSQVLSSLTVTNIGHQLAQTPQNSFSIYSTYDITPQFTIGGGAFYVGSRWINVANDALLPAYWRYDAMAAYRVNKNLQVQFNIYNIANTYYYDSGAGFGSAIPGAGRYVALSAKISY